MSEELPFLVNQGPRKEARCWECGKTRTELIAAKKTFDGEHPLKVNYRDNGGSVGRSLECVDCWPLSNLGLRQARQKREGIANKKNRDILERIDQYLGYSLGYGVRRVLELSREEIVRLRTKDWQ